MFVYCIMYKYFKILQIKQSDLFSHSKLLGYCFFHTQEDLRFNL